jgi:glycosyltransferase involved in cell wall biosynthesis
MYYDHVKERFLYASVVGYNGHIYENLNYDSYSSVLSLSTLTYKKTGFFPRNNPAFGFYKKLCRSEIANENVSKHYWLGIWQFYLPLRNRLIKSPAKSYEHKFLSYIYTRKLNRLLTKVDVAIISSDFLLEKIIIPNGTRVYLECRSINKNFNSRRPPLEYEIPYPNIIEGPDKWEESFVLRMKDFNGLITYSSVSGESFRESGFTTGEIRTAPLPVVLETVKGNIHRISKSLLWIGRGYPSKGLDIAVKISCDLGLNLTVVGALGNDLVDWIGKFPNVQYKGRQSRIELNRMMQEHEILLVPTIESYGLVVLEGLHNGMKVVTSPYVGINDWLNQNPNLYTSEEFSVKELIKKTGKALTSSYHNIQINIPVSENWKNVLSNL